MITERAASRSSAASSGVALRTCCPSIPAAAGAWSGHNPHLEQPAETLRAVRDFVSADAAVA